MNAIVVVVVLIVFLLDSSTALAISCPPGVAPLTSALFAEPGTSRVHAIGYCNTSSTAAPTNYFYVISTNGGVDFFAAPNPFPSSAIVGTPMAIAATAKYVVITGRPPKGTNVTVAVSINNGAFATVVLPFNSHPDALTVTSQGVFLIGDQLSAVYSSNAPEIASSWTKSFVGQENWTGIVGFAQTASGALFGVGWNSNAFGIVLAFDSLMNWWLPVPKFHTIFRLTAIATNGTALVATGNSLIASSFDGGVTWLGTPINADFQAVSYEPTSGLWTVASQSSIFVSYDAVQWNVVLTQPSPQVIFFMAASNGTVVVGGGGPAPLLVSLSKGAKWMPSRIH